MITTSKNNIVVTTKNNAIITNEGNNTLKKHLEELIPNSKETKILIACFEFSGVMELYKALKELYDKGDLSQEHIKILVGLYETDEDIAEPDYEENFDLYKDEDASKSIERKDMFVDSFANSMTQFIERSLTNQKLSNEEMQGKIEFFIKLLREKVIVIKKTMKQSSSIIYLFKTKTKGRLSPNVYIVGSSNLSRRGLVTQKEMNVRSADRIGFKEAEKHFDRLWKDAIPLSENDIEKLEKAGLGFLSRFSK